MSEETPLNGNDRLYAAQDEGARDYHARPDEFRPPYQRGTPLYDYYERGWSQALRKSDHTASTYNSSYSSWYPEPEPKMYTPPKRNPYANVKG